MACDFDRERFFKKEIIDAARVPARHTNTLLKAINGAEFVWSRPGCKSVYPCPIDAKGYRIVLLKAKLPQEICKLAMATATTFELLSTYEDLSVEQVLRALLPSSSDPPASFETIGHIAHMNLRNEFQEFKHVIGQVVLDKNRHIEVVVTKVGELSGDFRTFQMEIIASRNNNRSLVAVVSENKMRLTIDYAECYWNSRLSSERQRLLKAFKLVDSASCRLLDMCCGIGALACFCAKEGMEVFANDLNPNAVSCLRINALANHVEVSISNEDARTFVRGLVRSGRFTQGKVNQVMINLPEIGLSFLDVFVGLFENEDQLGTNEFKIYCHCFSREQPPDSEVRQRVNEALALDESDDRIALTVVHVRDVAPNKIMYSVEFEVPEWILITNKKLRLE